LPINRSFDGFLIGGENHFTEMMDCAVDFWKNMVPDTRDGTHDTYTEVI